MDILEFIVKYLEKKHTIDHSVDLETLNYVESGYVDSLGIIQFVCELEDEFDIEFSEQELSSQSFQVVGQLKKLIETKIAEKKKV
ncbi:phosphopantetheine-binding protein [Robertmurraya korlensis]|uniref:phosphopantetheine-binding protein n=1 Tax=Robertmurraya korlensis TaxID=519977 RepID=UPI000826D080|nr:phosphopantetheine-binding protein [Robertmurraya korlensis]